LQNLRVQSQVFQKPILFPRHNFHHRFDVFVTVHHIWKWREVPTWCNNYDLSSPHAAVHNL